jgi:hypothetical protein
VKSLFLIASCLFLLTSNGCGLFKDLGSNFGEGVIEPVQNHADTIGYNLVSGMQSSLTDSVFQQKLDSMISQLGSTANLQIRNILDSLIGNKTKEQLGSLRDELIGDTTVKRLVYLRNSLLDDYLKNYLLKTTAQIGPQFLNDSTVKKLAVIRDTLLGKRSNALIKSIVDSMMVTFAGRFKTNINPLLKENLSFVEKNASWLLILIGAIALAISAFIWGQKQKYLKMTKLLTYQISEIQGMNAKEIVKESISRNAKTIGVEDELRKLLDQQGLLHLDSKISKAQI